jgi:hypothetical protein
MVGGKEREVQREGGEGEVERERRRGFHISVKGRKGPGGCSQESHCPNRKIHSLQLWRGTNGREREKRRGNFKTHCIAA